MQGGREFGVLGEESVTRVDGLGSGAHRGVDHLLDVEVALPGRRGADQDRGVGLGDVPRLRVGLAEDGHGADAHPLEGADDAHGDLAAVGNQNGVKGHIGSHIRNTP